ncbi:hypothetical protein VTK26DRAFT_2882 [Humicola hyalothermophila]
MVRDGVQLGSCEAKGDEFGRNRNNGQTVPGNQELASSAVRIFGWVDSKTSLPQPAFIRGVNEKGFNGGRKKKPLDDQVDVGVRSRSAVETPGSEPCHESGAGGTEPPAWNLGVLELGGPAQRCHVTRDRRHNCFLFNSKVISHIMNLLTGAGKRTNGLRFRLAPVPPS